MKLKKITIQNLQSFREPTTIEFPDVGEKENIFLIGGVTGAGKTTLADAVIMCLHGAEKRKVLSNINREEKKKGNRDVDIRLVIETDGGDELHLHRCWRDEGNKKERFRERHYTQHLDVYKNGENIAAGKRDILQDYINSLIPREAAEFFFFIKDQIRKIEMDDSGDKIKDSLDSVLGIWHILQLRDDLESSRLMERLTDFEDVAGVDVDLKRTEISERRLTLKKTEQEKTKVEKHLKKVQSEGEEAKKKLNRKYSEFDEKFAIEVHDRGEKKGELTAKKKQKQEQIESIIENHLPLAPAAELFPPLVEKLEAGEDSKVYTTLYDMSEQLSESIVSAIDGKVPPGEDSIPTELRDELKDEILKVLREKCRASVSRNIGAIFQEKDKRQICGRIEEFQRSGVSELEKLIEDRNRLADEIALVEESPTEGISKKEQDIYSELKSIAEESENQMHLLRSEQNTLDIRIKDISENITELENELNELSEKQKISDKKKALIREKESISALLEDFVGKIRNSKINMLRENTFNMFHSLFRDSDSISDLQIDEDSFRITLTDQHHQQIGISSLSDGEREIFAFSLLWGLTRISELNLPVIFDAPLEQLDENYRDKIVSSYFPEAADQVVIISSNTAVDEKAFSTLKPFLCGWGLLDRDQNTLKTNYFWEK